MDGNDSLFPEEVQDKYYLVAIEAEYRRIEYRARNKLVETRVYNIGNPQAQQEPEQRTDTEFVEREIATAAKLWAGKEEASYFMAEKMEEETPEEETARRKTARDIAGRNSGDVAGLIEEVFVNWEIGTEYWRMLLQIAEDLVAKDELSDELFSGLVIAGFGESEHFPTVQHIEIGGVYGGKLKARPPQVRSVSEQNPSQVMSFAYTEMVESFLYGISPDALDHLDNAAEFIRKMPAVVTKTALDLPSEKKAEIDRIVLRTSEDKAEEFLKAVLKDAFARQAEARKAVEMLTIQELAQVASTLVNLSSFQQQMSLGQQTVGGPVDVAVISKGDGFVWIDRKHYFRPDLNNHFFQTYYESASKDAAATSGTQGEHDNG